jgi:hypothetical protein
MQLLNSGRVSGKISVNKHVVPQEPGIRLDAIAANARSGVSTKKKEAFP